MYYFKKISKIILFVFVGLIFFLPNSTFAAVLSIFPTSGAYKIGDTFNASVNISSYTQSMGAVSGTISFPKDLLSVVSISKNNSVLSTWLPAGSSGPTYNTSSGIIHFEGSLAGGYKGGPKNVFIITFKVKKNGTANLFFKNGIILADDGKGTDITQSLKSSSYKLNVATKPVAQSLNKNIKTASSSVISGSIENSSVIDVTPPVVTSNIPVVQIQKTTEVNNNLILIIILCVLVVLVLTLLIKVIQLNRMVKKLQSKKRTILRRKTEGFSTQKTPARKKQNNINTIKVIRK